MLNIPKIAATVNITPDSFSDGGVNFKEQDALRTISKLLEEGADIIDIGGESTRPNLAYKNNQSLGSISTIGHNEEWERLSSILPQAIQLCEQTQTKISLDSRNYETFKKALDLGINIINDVSGLADERVIDLVTRYNAQIIVMHNLGLPANPDIIIDESIDATNFIAIKLKALKDKLINRSIKDEQIILDPGIGFGQTGKQAAEVLRKIDIIKALGSKVMVGHSRKSFFNQITNLPYSDRDLETHIISVYLALKNVDILRVHDLIGTKRAFAAATLVF